MESTKNRLNTLATKSGPIILHRSWPSGLMGVSRTDRSNRPKTFSINGSQLEGSKTFSGARNSRFKEV